jgi:uncharacterized membrane protein YidH (DUF202 family)
MDETGVGLGTVLATVFVVGVGLVLLMGVVVAPAPTARRDRVAKPRSAIRTAVWLAAGVVLVVLAVLVATMSLAPNLWDTFWQRLAGLTR